MFLVFCFTANLKPYTFHERREDERFDAYLLSADYVRGSERIAAEVRSQKRHLVADNGNVDLLRDLAEKFRVEAKPLDDARRAWERRVGRCARPRELPADLVRGFGALARRIVAASEALTSDAYAEDALSRQSSIAPTFIIGMEDLTLGTLAALNVEPEYTDLPTAFYEARAARAIDFAQRSKRGALGPVVGHVLAGLHALDFDGAVLAGRMAAEANLEGVAVGLFGALTDRNFVDFRVEAGSVVELARAIPRPYLRVIEIASGIAMGYHEAERPRPAFHALGAGSPILLPLLGLLGGGERYFATDSTAPIVDGWSSPTISLYVNDPAPLKYKAFKIADSWIRGGRGWDCECRHCTGFHDAHPPDIDGARRWWKANGKPKITKLLLERDGPLSSLLPLMAYPADDGLRREASLARVGHNHSMLQMLQDEVRRHSADPAGLLAWVDGIVAAYETASESPAWSAAVREAHAVARRTCIVVERLEGGASTPS